MRDMKHGVLSFILLAILFIFPNVKNQTAPSDLPTKYDWREQGYDFPVLDQGGCQAGYAFAAVGAVQAAIWKNEGDKVDFSENHAIECNWHVQNDYFGSPNHCDEGNFRILANLFTQEGLVLESCDPYIGVSNQCNRMCKAQYRIKEWYEFSPAYQIPAPEIIKNLILDYGPLYTQMDPAISGFSTYSGNHVLYNYSGSDPEKYTHGVLIVGWNDRLSYPGGKGAWIVKNSYGTDWGMGGYFYIAYGKAGIGSSLSTVTNWEEVDIFTKVHFYDEAGRTSQIGIGGVDFLRGSTMALFQISTYEIAQGVEFWTTDAALVNVQIYEYFDGSQPKNLLFEAKDVSFPFAGYHHIPIPKQVNITGPKEIAVVVSIQNVSQFFPIAVDLLGIKSIGKTWFLNSESNWQPLSSSTGFNYDATMRLRSLKIPDEFDRRNFLPLIVKN